MSIERGDDGPVRIRRGRHAGTLGYYDDDLDGKERAAKAIVYLGEPFRSSPSVAVSVAASVPPSQRTR